MAEAYADRAARRRVDRCVDADHRAIHVEKRAARIAAIDRRIGLDEVIAARVVDVSAARAHDPGGHRAAKTIGIADREHPVADPGRRGVAEGNGGQRVVRVNAQQRDVHLRVPSDQVGGYRGTVREGDADAVGAIDHVVVGHDQT